MEEIKCPSCGSGAVRKITEEKYECMACDNLFLVHNLSKEFLKTDEHIENIHQDLKKTIENINLLLLPEEVEEMVWITVIKMP